MLTTGDLVLFRDKKFGHHHLYEVRAVVIGIAQQESIVTLVSLTHNAGRRNDGTPALFMDVPEVLLRSAEVFTPAKD